MENDRNVDSLRRGLGSFALLELILLAAILVTFFGVLDHTKDTKHNFARTSYQTKVDLYDLRIEDNAESSLNDRVETGL